VAATPGYTQPQTPPPAAAPPNYQPQPPTTSIAPGNPPLALDGCCCVSLWEKQTWVPGNVAFGAIHRGRTYLFAGPEEQRKFLADPDHYAPVVSGNDVVLAAEQGRAVPGRRQHGVYYGNRIYLFASEESLSKFSANPAAYANQVQEALRDGNYPVGSVR
jgi:YHS domain-containing protein